MAARRTDPKTGETRTWNGSAWVPEALPQAVEQPQAQPGVAEAVGRGVAQGATMGFGDEFVGAAEAAGRKLGDAVYGLGGQAGYGDRYRQIRDEGRAANQAAQDAHGGAYFGGQVLGGLATAALPGAAPATLGKAALAGAGYGAAAGFGTSDADVTKGDIRGAAEDTAKGAAFGGLVGAAAKPAAQVVGAGLGKAADAFRSLGQARLFKAAVGQNKRAFTQMDGKGLMDKAGQYLDDIGVGWGDSTESIAQKLTAKRNALGDDLTNMIGELDAAAGGKVAVSPAAVADRIEKEVAAKLKRLAAARGEYAQVMDEVKAIRDIGNPLKFAEAVEQRAAAQKQVNYDVKNGRDIAAEARRQIATIWNDVIDDEAKGLLKSAGKADDAYRELRHEFSLAQELLGHVNSRVQGNAANRVISPSDYGVGGIAGVMTANPFIGVAGAVANHLGRIYGNSAAGRSAIGMAKVAARGGKSAEAILPPALRSTRVMPNRLNLATELAEDERPRDRRLASGRPMESDR